MEFELRTLCAERVGQFKKDMQDAFRQGAVEIFGETDEEILPESHIDRAMSTEGAVSYEAFVDGQTVGGAVVVIGEKTQHNHLAFLYVKPRTTRTRKCRMEKCGTRNILKGCSGLKK